ncbi:hypothetical protein FOL47_004010 [Perkinsus chesapeaki]|uniref:LicD/FKTN/FKRP nucleotidyltransferase domain-containing protein n=1 Tax=Perkinsus chesapeaki TaxID=330153 RepID=A0A7J6M6B2_PERCH|nr:hypothetical protein FOL47_004010 [Perkinsus chesapeaki]
MFLIILLTFIEGGWSAEHPHAYIRVVADAAPTTAPLEKIFLCPLSVKDEVETSRWPKEEILINSTLCLNHEEILAMETRSKFFECMTEVINTTTHVLDKLGVDASLSDGSLLGWYRHSKTFIPWDLDADMTLLKENCRESFKKNAISGQKNMAEVIQARLPAKDYRATAIKSGVGSEVKSDTWEKCEADELRVVHRVGKVSCHVDLFFLYRSNDKTAPCKCEGNNDGKQLCGKFGKLCANHDDLFPSKWDVQDGADCRVPKKPLVSLQLKYGRPGMPGIAFTNMKKVPLNYKFNGGWMVVIGTAVKSGVLVPPKKAEASNLRGFGGEPRKEVQKPDKAQEGKKKPETEEKKEAQKNEKKSPEKAEKKPNPPEDKPRKPSKQAATQGKAESRKSPTAKGNTGAAGAGKPAKPKVDETASSTNAGDGTVEDGVISIPEINSEVAPVEVGIKEFVRPERPDRGSNSYNDPEEHADDRDADDGESDQNDNVDGEVPVQQGYGVSSRHGTVDMIPSVEWVTTVSILAIGSVFIIYFVRTLYRKKILQATVR